MNTTSRLTVRDVDVEVVYKDIKNLHIGVYPPDGYVRVAAPVGFDDDRVRLAVVQRLTWINRRRRELQSAQRQTPRRMLTGETHYVWGNRYRLRINERPGRAHIALDGDRLAVYIRRDTSAERCRELLDRWYRDQLRAALPPLIATWEQRMSLSVPKWSVRRMKTKWGSCNRQTHHIWFNTELAKKHPECLEYIVVHEMCHYIERNHGDAFTALMDRYLSDWRHRRRRLNDAPLAEENWTTV